MRAEINYVVHSTEDPDRILISLSKFLGLKVDKRDIRKNDVTGHYGNPLSYVTIRIKSEYADYVLKKILAHLSKHEKIRLLDSLDEYFDSANFYLRLNKQNICIGFITLSEEDAIRVVFKGIRKEYVRKLLEGSVM